MPHINLIGNMLVGLVPRAAAAEPATPTRSIRIDLVVVAAGREAQKVGERWRRDGRVVLPAPY
jgi:hypothetical protein